MVSPAFLQKRWPEAELHVLMTRRIEDKLRLLPVWHNVDRSEVAAFSRMLADLVALETAGKTAQDVALALLVEIRPDLYEAKGRSELERLATGKAFEELEEELSDLRNKVSDLLCPTCEAPLVERIPDADFDSFECGHVQGGYYPQACPHDPAFPPLTDYELKCEQAGSADWLCVASPLTRMAKRNYLSHAMGSTARGAKNRLIEKYNREARPKGGFKLNLDDAAWS